MDFIETVGVELDPILKSVDMFTSHEGLHLDYEEAMTVSNNSNNNNKYYNTGAHFIWIGDRTRQLTHAHVEYFRGIANPVGIKVGPSLSQNPKELVELIKVVGNVGRYVSFFSYYFLIFLYFFYVYLKQKLSK